MKNDPLQIDSAHLEKLIVPRFLNYVRYNTESDHHSAETPSSPGQWDLARALKNEISELGLTDVKVTDHCYVIARLPPSPGKENAPCVGFLAHLDTADDVSGKDVKPVREDDVIRSDGSTLLGADDKAGIAEIMAAVEFVVTNPSVEHGPVEIIFTPDEETGKGLPEFPMNEIKSSVCYTVDGGVMGEIETECFNAWKADVEFHGKAIHLGAARGELVNAALMAASFAVLLPRNESPEATDGYFGYYCPMEISGGIERASLEIYLRDFENEGMKQRLAALDAFANAIESQFPGGKVIVKSTPQYYNMKFKIDEKPEVLEKLKLAMNNAGVEWRLKPIRGGTDGSRLTVLGIPTPNIFTGGRNFHSRTEWVSVSEMCAACRVIIELTRIFG